MKKYLPIILAGLALGGCSKNLDNPDDSNLNIISAPNLEKISQDRKMPKDLFEISEYLIKNIIYYKDKKEFWNSPEKTIKEGVGDCDDMAILGSYFAERLGYSPKVLFLVEENNSAHLVTLLEENNQKYGAIEDYRVYCPVYNSINALIIDINRADFRNYCYYSVIDLNFLNKNWRTSEDNLIYPKKQQNLDLISVNGQKRTRGCSVGKLYFESE
jgi:hypothetical protein